jgi:hypothetical protein
VCANGSAVRTRPRLSRSPPAPAARQSLARALWVSSSTTACATTLDARAARAVGVTGPAVVPLSMSSRRLSMRREILVVGQFDPVRRSAHRTVALRDRPGEIDPNPLRVGGINLDRDSHAGLYAGERLRGQILPSCCVVRFAARNFHPQSDPAHDPLERSAPQWVAAAGLGGRSHR